MLSLRNFGYKISGADDAFHNWDKKGSNPSKLAHLYPPKYFEEHSLNCYPDIKIQLYVI